ncbi:MAG: hypothetical protein J0I06_12500 [Planctomycetes bacterium]|nr:hypothetical protein [Planctomycetota bacterium]
MWPYRLSIEAQNQLAGMYNAFLAGALTLGELQELDDWFERNVYQVLGDQGFDAFGSPGTRLYGMLTDPSTRVLVATELPRTVRVIVTRDAATDEVSISAIIFRPAF